MSATATSFQTIEQAPVCHTQVTEDGFYEAAVNYLSVRGYEMRATLSSDGTVSVRSMDARMRREDAPPPRAVKALCPAILTFVLSLAKGDTPMAGRRELTDVLYDLEGVLHRQMIG